MVERTAAFRGVRCGRVPPSGSTCVSTTLTGVCAERVESLRRGVREDDAGEFGGVGVAAFVGEGGFFVGDGAAVVFAGEGVGGEGDEAGASEGIEEDVELFAVDAEREVGVELAGGARGCVGEGGEDGAEVAGLRGGGRGEGLRGGGVGRAEVACTAGTMSVGGIAEVADDGGHAALLGFGEGGHAVELGAAEGDLGFVAGAPGLGRCSAAGAAGCVGKANVAGQVDGGDALGDELFGGLVEAVEVHFETLGERLGHEEGFGIGLGGEDLRDAGEVGGGRVVTLEEKLVHLAIGVAVEEDGARWFSVASGAADLLVIGLDGGGQGGVDDGADIGFVDAHAEGDGGDDDFELAGLEGVLNALADGGLEAGVIGCGDR